MSGNVYIGSQDQSTTASDYNARDYHIQQRISEISTATLVQVVRAPYDSSGKAITPGSPVPVGFIDVQPLVNQVDGQNQATPHKTVYKLSYFRYESGNGAFINDPVVGDQGKMVSADRDTSGVKTTKAQGNPGSGRRFDLADGTYFGLTQSKTAPKQYFAWLASGFNLKDSFGNTMVGTAQGVLINGCLIKLNGDVVTKHGTDLDTHVHTLTTPGSGNSGPPP